MGKTKPERLLRDARRGAESAFLRLFDDHHLPLFRYAWRLTGSTADAEDIVQECFLALLRPECNFDPARTAVRTYLFGAVRNQTFKRLRRRETTELPETVSGHTPESEALLGERSRAVEQAIGRLPESQREVLVLAHYEQLSLAEIAEITGEEVTTVKSRLQRARAEFAGTIGGLRAAEGADDMTDIELDRMLDSWQAPEPPPSLRVRVRDRFPRAERRRFPLPLRWLLVAAVFATLSLGMQQSSSGPFYIFERLRDLVSPFFDGIRFYHASEVLVRVRDFQPQVFVDGVPAPQPLRIRGSHIAIEIPGDGIYQVMLVAPASMEGLTQTGQVHGNVLDFQAGGRHVRIVCNQPLSNRDYPVYVRRQ